VNKALLGTDTLSEIRKGSNPTVAANAKTYRRAFGHYSLSTVTVLEIVRGYQKAQQFQRLNASSCPGRTGRNLYPFATRGCERSCFADFDRQAWPQVKRAAAAARAAFGTASRTI
jgi:hypothetical protein